MSDDSFSLSQMIDALASIVNEAWVDCKVLQSDGKEIIGLSIVRSVKRAVAIKLITDVKEIAHE